MDNIAKPLNTPIETIIDQVDSNLKMDLPIFIEQPENKGKAIIVGGGPSLEKQITDIRFHVGRGGILFALNGVYDYLVSHGIQPHFHVILDARKENAEFVRNPSKKTTYLIASQCHPDVFKAIEGYDVIMWTSCLEAVEQEHELAEKHKDIPLCFIGGGSTVGLKTIFMAYLWGFRDFRIFGFDSSYCGEENHAYTQSMNESESVEEVDVDGTVFKCATWMKRQADEFFYQFYKLIALGCKIKVYGDGLLPHMVKQINKEVKDV